MIALIHRGRVFLQLPQPLALTLEQWAILKPYLPDVEEREIIG